MADQVTSLIFGAYQLFCVDQSTAGCSRGRPESGRGLSSSSQTLLIANEHFEMCGKRAVVLR